MADTVDWVEVEKVIRLAASLKRLPDDTKAAIKKHLKQTDGKHTGTFLTALTVLDSVALNSGRETRNYLSSTKWMKRLTQSCSEVSTCSTAVCQLLVNWEHVFKGEELGAAAHASRRQLQGAGLGMPKPDHFAVQMREMIDQQIPFIGFQHGKDFAAAFLQRTSPSGSNAGRTASGGWLQRLQGNAPQQARHSAPLRHDKPDQGPGSFKGEYLEQMEKDAVTLEVCTKEVRSNLIKRDISRSMRARISHGQDSALRCRQWRENIQLWVGGVVQEDALGQMLRLNDRMHAALTNWQATTEEHAEACSREQVIQPRTSRPAGRDEHQASPTQWFSPLGSSVTRFISESRSSTSTDSLGSEVSSRPEEPAVAPQQLHSSSPRASSGVDLLVGRQPPGTPCGAVQERQQQPVVTGGNGAQQDAVSDLLGLHITPMSTWPVSKCSTVQQVPGSNGLQPMGWERRNSAATESCTPAYQQEQHQTSRMHVSEPATVWEMQWPPVTSAESLPATQAAHDFWHTPEAGRISPSPVARGSAIGLSSQVQGLLLASDPAMDRDIQQGVCDNKDAELAALRQQLEEERSGRLDLQHKLHACRAAEERLVADVCLLQSQVKQKNVELEEYKRKLRLREEFNKGDDGQSRHMSAYCRQPALRLRFSASEFQALASLLNKY